MARWTSPKKRRQGDWTVDLSIHIGSSLVLLSGVFLFTEPAGSLKPIAIALIGIGLILHAAAWWIKIIMSEVQDLTWYLDTILEDPDQEGASEDERYLAIDHIRRLIFK